MNKEEALNTARRLIKEAVAVATEAGIDPASIVAVSYTHLTLPTTPYV